MNSKPLADRASNEGSSPSAPSMSGCVPISGGGRRAGAPVSTRGVSATRPRPGPASLIMTGPPWLSWPAPTSGAAGGEPWAPGSVPRDGAASCRGCPSLVWVWNGFTCLTSEGLSTNGRVPGSGRPGGSATAERVLDKARYPRCAGPTSGAPPAATLSGGRVPFRWRRLVSEEPRPDRRALGEMLPSGPNPGRRRPPTDGPQAGRG
jgi:hypothetical protein